MLIENRQNNRIQWYTNVYPKECHNNKCLPIGIVTNISREGINLWIDNKKVNVNNNFSIILQAPDELNIEPFEIDLMKVWDKFYQELESQQIGCLFINISSEQMKYLTKIINFLEDSLHTPIVKAV